MLIASALVALGVWRWSRVAAPISVLLLEPPKRDAFPTADGDGATLINGHRVTPAGRLVLTQSYSWGMAVSPDDALIALIRPDVVGLVPVAGQSPSVRMPPVGVKPLEEMGEGTCMGVAFSADGRRLDVGSASSGDIKETDLATLQVARTLSIDGGGYQDRLVGDFVLSSSGTEIHALDQFNSRLVTIDIRSGALVQSVRVGRHPFSASLAPGGRRA